MYLGLSLPQLHQTGKVFDEAMQGFQPVGIPSLY